jgi:ABC-type sugar transport system ATPase subunit
VAITDFNMERRFMSRMSVRDNLCLACYPRLTQLGLLRENRIRFVEQEFAKWYGSDELIGLDRCTKLSDREKIAIYLFTLRLQNPRLLICADPSVSADYAVSQMIYKELNDMAERGAAILMLISSGDWDGTAADRAYRIPAYSLIT